VKRWKQQVEGLRKIARILLETGADFPRAATGKLPGDTRALRGIPVVGARGVGGTMADTQPEKQTLKRDEQAERQRRRIEG
jgi:hypothetical protein